MKKLYTIIMTLVLSNLIVLAQNTDSTIIKQDTTSIAASPWDKANDAYSNGQYQVAEVLYLQLIKDGYQDASVYYNLGNTYFQQNQIGKAILNFKRAYLANPSDDDIKYNLELAQSKTKDKIDKLPSFFLVSWVNSIRDLLNTNTWAKLSIIFLVIDLGMILLWLLAHSLAVRKIGFYAAIISSALFIISLLNGYMSANYVYNSKEAIVTSSAAIIKSSPSENGKDLFVVHEGISVIVRQELEGWNEVELADGNKGWVLSSAIEEVIIDK